jgi:hypothetical protein
MLEIVGSGLLGSIFGGLFRLAPEVLKWLDRKNERQHELSMFQQQCQLEAQRGSQKLQEIGAQRDMAVDVATMDAFKAAIESQTDMAKAAPGWVAALSASVRPIVTYALIGTYLLLQIGMAVNAGSVAEASKLVITPDFVSLVSGTFNYWLLNRTLEKRSLA